MTATTTNACADCGQPAPTLEVLGSEIRMPYCTACAGKRATAEDGRQRDEMLEQALRRAGGTPRLAQQTLETHPNQEAREFAEKWMADYDAGERRNLWLTGSVGQGKTGLAWAIVHCATVTAVERYWAADDGYGLVAPALFIRWADLLDDLKAAFDADRRALAAGDVADPSQLLERAKRIPILALDDLGRERPTPYAVDKLANLVESRYQRVAPTIITSNFKTAELAARLGTEATVDGHRIIDRLREGAVGFRFEGESLRRRA